LLFLLNQMKQQFIQVSLFHKLLECYENHL
jgi:hypothetical protein